MSAKRMGGLGKLSDFSQTSNTPTPSPATAPAAEQPSTVKGLASNVEAPKTQDKLVTINIKIPRSQHEWLNDTARQVRDNNTQPVSAAERVYPQHLIQVAIDLLCAADVDWEQVKSVEHLKQHLNR